MAKNFAIAIGINGYEHLGQPLKYAKRDAESIRNFFLDEMKFEEVFLYTDDSPPIQGASTRPTRSKLLGLLNNIFKETRLEAGDNFWFFFSGHGELHNGKDYLMPCDAFPDLVQDTAISVDYVIRCLRLCGADNIILLLDACRNSNRKSAQGVGQETSKLVRQTGIISLFSCSPYEYSYEIDELKQGAFTYALVESLRIQGEGNCATVERLNGRLSYRVREINQLYGKPGQTPYAIVEPAPKYHLILLEKQATEQDILTLISDAQDAEIENNLKLSVELWTRVLAVSPANPKAVKALMRIAQKLQNQPTSTPQIPVSNDNSGSKSVTEGVLPTFMRFWQQLIQPSEPERKPISNDSASRFPRSEMPTMPEMPTIPEMSRMQEMPAIPEIPTLELEFSTPKPQQQLSTFQFDVVTLDTTGKERQRHRDTAEYFTENLGNGVTLDMVKIPAGEFLMGSRGSEEGSYKDERPQHRVRVDSFFMGKYAVTQAQWIAVASLPKLQRDLNPDPSNFKGENRPVEQISWYDAVEFCARLSKHTGKSYCLPSEAQWEYACRAGTTTPFHFGETISTDVANYRGTDWEYQGTTYPGFYGSGSRGEFRQETTPVGSFQVANNFGLFDMHGNVWEWCADPWRDNYEGAPADGSVWDEILNKNYIDYLVNTLDTKTSRVIRGGSWYDLPRNCCSAYRDDYDPGLDDSLFGFRVVRVPPRT